MSLEQDTVSRTSKPLPLADLDPRSRAVVETALAYYYRGHAVQYDSEVLTRQPKYAGPGANIRETDFYSPEDATENDTMFAVCTSYCFEIFYNVFGYQVNLNPLNCKTFYVMHHDVEPTRIYRFMGKKEDADLTERYAALAEMRAMLRPGDMVVTLKESGHAMLYIGDAFGDGTDYFLHCWGKKYHTEQGCDRVECDCQTGFGGAIRCQPAAAFFESEKATWALRKCWEYCIVRPSTLLDPEKYPLTPSALTRLQYPRLDIDRVATHDRFRDAAQGEEITVTVTVTNRAPCDYTAPIPITERIPPYCRLKEGSVTGGGHVSGNTIVWEPTLKKGYRAVCSYTVVADAPDSVRGRTIELGGGTVGAIPSNTIPVRIGGKHLPQEKQNALSRVTEGQKLTFTTPESFAEALYEKVLGLRPGIPALSDFEKNSFERREADGCDEPMLHPVETDFAGEAMRIPFYFGGREVRTDTNRERLMNLETFHLLPGDVLLAQPGALPLPACMVYLGNDRFAAPGEDGNVTIVGPETLERIFTAHFFMGLRPTLAYDDLCTEAVFEDDEVDEAAIAAIADGPDAEERRMALRKKKSALEKARKAAEKARKQAEYDMRVRAVIETALAYWRRGAQQQYESVDLTYISRLQGGVNRATNYVSPEDGTMDTPSYFVCSTYTYNIYWEAIRYHVGIDHDHCSTSRLLQFTNRATVYHYIANGGESIEDAVDTVRRLLRPGDVIVGMKSSGHAMLYMGDCLHDGRNYVTHSWGRKYSMDTGLEGYEDEGTIRLDDAEELLFNRENAAVRKKNKDARWCMYEMDEFIIIRPLQDSSEETYPLSANARARLAHPGLDITRTADFCGYRTLPAGGNITYTVTVKNCSDRDYTAIPVTEKLPAGTALVSDGGASAVAGTLTWLLDLPAGTSETVSYTVGTAGLRGDVVSEGGDVAGIRSNRIVTHLTGENLTERQQAVLAGLAAYSEGKLAGESLPGMAFARRVYEQFLGRTLALPDTTELLRRCFERVPFEGEHDMLRLTETPVPMLIPKYWGGKMLSVPNTKRILEFSLDRLYPGDILLYVTEPLSDAQKEEVYLYLGDGAFACMTQDGLAVTREELLWRAFQKDLFLAFRPAVEE